jgi:hypothetical protein
MVTFSMIPEDCPALKSTGWQPLGREAVVGAGGAVGAVVGVAVAFGADGPQANAGMAKIIKVTKSIFVMDNLRNMNSSSN